jgi:outer membrane lipoprotein carrier protein
MRNLITGLLMGFSISVSWCQDNPLIQDPAAGKVLERVSMKFKSLQSVQADFALTVEDRKEKIKNTSTGHLMLKQKKYQLKSEGSTVYFDGTTMWTYISANNEVTVTEPKIGSTDFMTSPSTFFSTYKTEFKYKYVGEGILNGIACHEIDLFPKNLEQPYSRIKIYVNKISDLPEEIKSVGKDGVDYTIILKNMVLNRDLPDALFIFDPAKYKKVEIVDMRGI